MASSENPFSFKAFVNRREKGNDEGDIKSKRKQKAPSGKSRGGKTSLSSGAQLSEEVLFPEALGYSTSTSCLLVSVRDFERNSRSSFNWNINLCFISVSMCHAFRLRITY